MRLPYLLATSAAALAALVACAAADGDAVALEPARDGGTVVPEVASPIEADAATPTRDASAPVWSACNDHGWCETELPGPDLTLFDVWPFEKRAFAVAQSETLGTKLLEWTEATAKWTYVDDNSQNAYGRGHYTGKMFAPSENEVYFITAPGLVFHGTRANPQSAFTWESARLPYDGPVYPDRDPGIARRSDNALVAPPRFDYALGVFGTSEGDVYAWFGNRIFRRTRVDGAPPTWVSEFVAEDPDVPSDESFYIFNAAKGEGDEVWFVGGRGTYVSNSYQGCPTLYRRTAAGYSAVINASMVSFSCSTRPGSIDPTLVIDIPGLGPYPLPLSSDGWGTAVLSVGSGQAVLLLDGNNTFYYIDLAKGIARLNEIRSVVPPVMTGTPLLHSGVRLGDRMWLSGHGIAFSSEIKKEPWEASIGIGTLEHFQQAGTEVGALLELSSVEMKGRYLNEPLYQVRGTSANNLWVVGNRYALHKKTP